jgi:outer membrane protein assembly factor BamB
MATGEILWSKELGSQTWGSPVVVDDTLIEGDCEGNLNAYDVSDPRVDPPLKWTVKLEGCIETTPAVWKDRIYLATRSGTFYALGEPPAASTTDSTSTTDTAPSDR